MSLHIDKFRQLVQANQQKKASTTTIDTNTAANVVHSIVELQNRVIDLQEKVIKLQDKVIESQTVEVEFDGGNFS